MIRSGIMSSISVSPWLYIASVTVMIQDYKFSEYYSQTMFSMVILHKIYEVENYQNKQRQIENNVIRRRNFGIDVYTESQLYHTDNITFLHDKSLVCPTMSRCNV